VYKKYLKMYALLIKFFINKKLIVQKYRINLNLNSQVLLK